MTTAPTKDKDANSAVVAIQVIMLFSYLFTFLPCAMLVFYLRYKRRETAKQNLSAPRKLILPSFEPLVWILTFATGGYTAFFILSISMRLYMKRLPRIMSEVFYGGRQFIFLLVMIFMMQKSVSLPALRRAVIISLAYSCYTIPIAVAIVLLGEPDHAIEWGTIQSARALILLFDIYTFIYPPSRATKPLMRQFSVFALVFHCLQLTTSITYRLAWYSTAYVFAFLTLIWCALSPVIVWRVLVADTEYWRGLRKNVCAFGSFPRQLEERICSEALHHLIEMHRHYVIDCAALEFTERIGEGCNSSVFKGVLYSKIPVAVKVYSPQYFTEVTIVQFSHEAVLCGSLHHPNIVKFYGLCISPPFISLVSEWCQASLDVITGTVVSSSQSSTRQKMIINLSYMIDAARAVAYMHSFSPKFLHCDITPANFLVDMNHTVKLTDFGEARRISDSYRISNHMSDPTTPSSSGYTDQKAMKGAVEYMAPEIINGKDMTRYDDAADVYSLAITFWDILHPGQEKYPSRNHMEVLEIVLAGRRPEFGQNLACPSRLQQLITAAWHPEPKVRPTARLMADTLCSIQKETLKMLVLPMSEAFETNPTWTISPSKPGEEPHFYGSRLVSLLNEWGSVDTLSEGIRLGNAFMEAGLLHHHKHNRSFKGNDRVYYWDVEQIQLAKEKEEEVQQSTVNSKKESKSTMTQQFKVECNCSVVGQRMDRKNVIKREHRRKKFKVTSDENFLTAKLLNHDSSFVDDDDVIVNIGND